MVLTLGMTLREAGKLTIPQYKMLRKYHEQQAQADGR